MERRLELLGAQANAHASAGQAVEARDALRGSLALLPPDAAAERVAVAAALAELHALWTQEPDDARRLIESERASLGDAAPALSAALTLVLARERAVHADHAAAEALAEEARFAARAGGDAALEAEAAAVAADAAHCRLREDDAAARAAVDAKIANAAALVGLLPDARVAERIQMALWLGAAHCFSGDFAAARAVAERGIRVARGSAQGLHAASFVNLRGWIEGERGRLDAAEADLDQALESAVVSGNVQVAYWAHVALSRTALGAGASTTPSRTRRPPRTASA